MKKEFHVIWVCTLIMMIFLTFTFIYMSKYKEELTASPLVYGAKKMEERYNSNLSCSCFIGHRSFILTGEGVGSPIAIENENPPEEIYGEINLEDFIVKD